MLRVMAAVHYPGDENSQELYCKGPEQDVELRREHELTTNAAL